MKRRTRLCGCGSAALALLAAAWLCAGTARGANVYVVPTNAAAAEPYDTWAKAAASIQVAVDYASAHIEKYNTVIITNGTYGITNQITIAKGITVRSVEGGLTGAEKTIVRPVNAQPAADPSRRLFSLSDPNAILQGLTLRDNAVSAGVNGNAVRMSAGLVRDCIITHNGFCDNHDGSGVYMSGGTVSNCIVRGNGGGSNVNGSGIYATGGQILNCQILDNVLWGGEGHSEGGGGIYANGAVLIRNCLIARNTAGGTAGGNKGGGGVYLANGTIESCTIVSNRAVGANGGGGIYRVGGTAGTIRNSIVVGNTSVHDIHKNMFSTTDAGVSFCCTTNPGAAGDGCLADDPLFVNPAAGDYRLQSAPVKSPCIDAGQYRDGMEADRDVEGKPRLFGDIVDMGAFETWPVVPLLRPAGAFKVTDKAATVRGQVTWVGLVEAALFLCHGPDDGGTNRAAWANVIRLPGPIVAGVHEVAITHAAGARTWCYRWLATNVNGEAWAETSGGLMLGAVEVKAPRRESTEERPAAFVFTRPAVATNGPIDVYFTLGGTGVNGVDYDRLESPVTIPVGAVEVRVPIVPNFSMGETQPKGVELTLAPGGYLIGGNSKASIVTKAQ